MYCISCGVKLADSEQKCPLCGVEVYHPQLKQNKAQSLYPAYHPPKEVSPWGVRLLITILFILPMIVVLLCDLPVRGRVTWSGYAMGALFLVYVIVMLPMWFRSPNPVIFVPVDFAVVAVYLLYINWELGGKWFLTFALPITGFCALVTTTVVTLNRYVRRGRLFIYGGAATAAGLFLPVMEYLLYVTFDRIAFTGWSFYPMGVLVLFGLLLMFLGICRPARELMERKFFL